MEKNNPIENQLTQTLGIDRDDTLYLLRSLATVIASCLTDEKELLWGSLGRMTTYKLPEQMSTHPTGGQRMLLPPKLRVKLTAMCDKENAKESMTLTQLGTLLAGKTRQGEGFVERFLQMVSDEIENELHRNGSVEIRFIGSFSHNPMDPSSKIRFTPDDYLSLRINAPYAHLSIILFEENGAYRIVPAGDELEHQVEDLYEGEQLCEERISIGTPTLETSSEEAQPEPEEIQETIVEDPEIEETPKEEIEEEDEKTIEPIEEIPIKQQTAIEQIPSIAPILPPAPPERAKRKSNRIGWIFFIICLGGAVGGYLYIYTNQIPNSSILAVFMSQQADSTNIKDSIVRAQIDSIKRQIQIDSIQLIKEKEAIINLPLDTLRYSSSMTLRVLGRKYYGDKSFWVYIYEENKTKIENFNMVPVGTILVIPNLSKYGIDPENPEDIRTARKVEEQLFREMDEKEKKK